MTRRASIVARCSILGLFIALLASTGLVSRTAWSNDSGALPRPAYTQTVPDAGIALDMVPVPGGTFTMGSPADEPGRSPDEGPQFRVEIEPFWMGKYEVTWDQYDKFRQEYNQVADEKVLDKTSEYQSGTSTPQWADAVSLPTPLWEQDSAPILSGMGSRGGYPAADISQYAAKQFTKWLSKKTGRFYRLPTEAEWEYAARAGTTTPWSFGNDPERLDAYGWYFDNSFYDDQDKGHPDFGAGYRKVGSKKPNPWGLFDMHGNVSEWVLDAYDEGHYAELAGKQVSWKDAICWPTDVFPRVVRGGNWNSEAEGCRSAARLASDRSWQKRDPQFPKSIWWYTDAFHVGFRVVSPAKEPPEKDKLRYWDADTKAEINVLVSNDKIVRAIIDKDEQAEVTRKGDE